MYGRRAFSVAGTMFWNSLPDDLRDNELGADAFRQYLKTIDFIFIVQVLLGFYENELPYESTFDFDFDLCKNLHDN